MADDDINVLEVPMRLLNDLLFGIKKAVVYYCYY
jgi:hypothetical protein